MRNVNEDPIRRVWKVYMAKDNAFRMDYYFCAYYEMQSDTQQGRNDQPRTENCPRIFKVNVPEFDGQGKLNLMHGFVNLMFILT